jgi:hypothetical protein
MKAYSTLEAGYVTLSKCTREVSWIKEEDKEKLVSGPSLVRWDSHPAIAYATNYICKDKGTVGPVLNKCHVMKAYPLLNLAPYREDVLEEWIYSSTHS